MTLAKAAAAEGAASLERGGASVPRHVAIIMDGNGRWAKRRGLARAAGHKAGAEAVRRTLQAAADAGVEVLTLYAFSSENWRRSEEEISDLKGLMRFYVEKELDRLIAERVKLQLIGDYRAFGAEMTRLLDNAVANTAGNDRLTLVVALNYGSQQEIASAAAKAALDGKVSVETIGSHLETARLPDLDLLVRTSGEVRLSNFLLWQAAYAELLFTPTLWPDFDEKAFHEILGQYAARQRRFGGR